MDRKSARESAIGYIEAIVRGDTNLSLGLDRSLFGREALGTKIWRDEVKKIMLEESGDTAIVAAYVLLEFDINEQAAITFIVRALEDNNWDRRNCAVSYVGRLPKLPTQAIPAVVNLLHFPDTLVRLTVASALRDASHEALSVLRMALRGDEGLLAKKLAASALARVDERARPDVAMEEIMAVMTQQLDSSDDQEQYVAIAFLRELGPAAVGAAPILIRLLADPMVKLGTRTLIIHILGNMGIMSESDYKEDVVKALVRMLNHSKRAKNWLSIILASESLGSLGEAPIEAVNDLLGLLDEPDKEGQLSALKSLRNFGPALEPRIDTLLELIKYVSDPDAGKAWTMMVAAIGPPAIRPLLQFIRTSPPEHFLWSTAALQAIGEEGSTAFVNLLFTDPDKDIRGFAAAFLSTVGKRAESAVPAIVKLLEGEDGEQHVEAAVTALKALGAVAISAAPALVRFLLNGSAWTNELAREGLINIGPDTIPALRQAFESANPDAKERIAELLGRWNFAIEDKAGMESLENDELLASFVKVLQILKDRGPTGPKAIGKELGEWESEIRRWRTHVEKHFDNQLVKRRGTKPWQITDEGVEFLAHALDYLNRKEGDKKGPGSQNT